MRNGFCSDQKMDGSRRFPSSSSSPAHTSAEIAHLPAAASAPHTVKRRRLAAPYCAATEGAQRNTSSPSSSPRCGWAGPLLGLLQRLTFQLTPGCRSQDGGLDTSDCCAGARGRGSCVNTRVLFNLDVAELFPTCFAL